MITGAKRISDAGVSIWLDDLGRSRIESGQLAKLVDKLNVAGVTTNPSIFNKAILSEAVYNAKIASLAASGATAEEILAALMFADVLDAADLFLPVFEKSNGADGRVSVEVDPRLARDEAGTVKQAEEIWRELRRPNVMIKIPATPEGLPAITQTIAKGIPVNATLIFSPQRYREVADAYLSGLEQALVSGRDLSRIHSVASFFVSRLDTAIDKLLEENGSEEALALRGEAAVANARVAYAISENLYAKDERWSALAKAGANKQRLLWASTGVKNPSYPPEKYVAELCGTDVVNTMPEATLLAVAEAVDDAQDMLTGAGQAAGDVLAQIDAVLGKGTVARTRDELETDGVDAFVDAWNGLLSDIEKKIEKDIG